MSYPLRKSLIMIFRGEIRKHIFKGVFDDRKELCDGIASLRASNGDFITPFEKIPLTFRFLKRGGVCDGKRNESGGFTKGER